MSNSDAVCKDEATFNDNNLKMEWKEKLNSAFHSTVGFERTQKLLTLQLDKVNNAYIIIVLV